METIRFTASSLPLMALFGHGAMSDLSPLCAPKRTPPTTTDLSVHALENSQGQEPIHRSSIPLPHYPHLRRVSIRPHKVRCEWRGLTFSLAERCS
jgi:hypothetical protein